MSEPQARNIRTGSGVSQASASEQVTAKTRAEYEVTDVIGRKIILRKPPFGAQFNLAGMIDDKLPGAASLRTMYGPLLYVAAIDGDPVAIPAAERELRALRDRLDEHGYVAVIEGIGEHFSKNEDKDAALKNS